MIDAMEVPQDAAPRSGRTLRLRTDTDDSGHTTVAAGPDDLETWFSLEERMGCGFGACAGCPAKLRMPDGSVMQKGVCKLGPVFPGKDVIFS